MKKQLWRSLLLIILLTACASRGAGAVSQPETDPAHSGSCLPGKTGPSPSTGTFDPHNPLTYSTLSSVSALSPSNVWAVGTFSNPRSTLFQGLIEHWNGSSWRRVASPEVGWANLNGVAATPSGNLWAVGYCSPTSSTKRTLIERWDGATWQVVPSPNISSAENLLSAVVAVSSANAWAVGLAYDSSPLKTQPLIEHWDGRSWRLVPGPVVEGQLNAVTALSSTDIWAVGNFAFRTEHPGELLIEHWDGSRWSLVHATNPQARRESLRGIAAVSASDIWAVGSHDISTSTLIEHWDGSHWSQTPQAQNISGVLLAVGAISATDIWAVGSHDASALIEHWDGTRWSVIAGPSAGAGFGSLNGPGLVSASDIWSVGEVDVTNTLARAFIEHWNGRSWSLIPLRG